MKISILGYSGSGKSTLARKLAQYYNCDVLHLDTVQWLPNWQSRPKQQRDEIINKYLDDHDKWVIEGNYEGSHFQRRNEEADLVIELLFNRFICLVRILKRYKTYKGKTRPDLTEGCPEKVDFDFIKWILYGGRDKRHRQKYKDVAQNWANKTIIIKNHRQLDKWEKENIKQ